MGEPKDTESWRGGKREEAWREATGKPPKEDLRYSSLSRSCPSRSPPIATDPHPYQPETLRIHLSSRKPVSSHSRPGTDRPVICTQLFTGTHRKASCYLCHFPLSNYPRHCYSNPSRRPPPGSGEALPCWNIPVPQWESATQRA